MMRRMISMRVLLTSACLRQSLLLVPIASAAIGCAADDTILALTIDSGDDVGAVARLQVTVSQGDGRELVADLAAQTEMTDAGRVIVRSYFERITLPGDWEHAPARIEVEAQDGDGSALFTAETTVRIRPEGAVAASVMLGADGATATLDAGSGDPEDDAGVALADGG